MNSTATKKIWVDFGTEKIEIDVPERAVIAEFADPPVDPNPSQAVARALSNPVAAPPLGRLAKAGTKVAIGFDDPTKPPAPVQCMLPVVVEALLEAGVSKQDISLISANGNHKKFSENELRAYLGESLYRDFWPGGQIHNHDCVDPEGLARLGETPGGCVVEHNKTFVEADLMIYLGQVVAHSWGGYTGTGAAIGLASTRSIKSHHNHRVVNHPESTSGDQKRGYFHQLKMEVNDLIEEQTGKRIFYVNWIGGTGGTISQVFAGYSPEVEQPAWDAADQFSLMKVPQADVLVIGMSQSFAYGNANNPLIAAIGMAYPPRIWLGDHVLREGGVVIGLHPSNGEIDRATYPSYQKVIDLYAGHYAIHDMAKHEQDIATQPGYLEQYSEGNAYHPIHPFWLLYSCDYLLSRAGAVILAGTRNPGAFRQLGITPASDFDHAWKIANRIVGRDPVTVVAPSFWSHRPFKFDVAAC